MVKECSKCGEIEEHNVGQTQCKKCYGKWYLTYQNRKRDLHYKKKFGISLKEYDALLNEQEGKCACCGKSGEEGRYKNMAVDHCHKTGKIRGILCSKCNRAAGLIGDTSEGALKLYNYLKENE